MAFQRQSSGCVLIEKQNLHNLKEENHAFATTFENEVFLTQLVYLCDIFFKLNQLNIFLKGKETHLLQVHDKITASKRKLQL